PDLYADLQRQFVTLARPAELVRADNERLQQEVISLSASRQPWPRRVPVPRRNAKQFYRDRRRCVSGRTSKHRAQGPRSATARPFEISSFVAFSDSSRLQDSASATQFVQRPPLTGLSHPRRRLPCSDRPITPR